MYCHIFGMRSVQIGKSFSVSIRKREKLVTSCKSSRRDTAEQIPGLVGKGDLAIERGGGVILKTSKVKTLMLSLAEV